MAPTATEEVTGEASGSRSRAGEERWRRRRTPAHTQSEEALLSQPAKRKAAPEPSERRERKKKVRAADKAREDEKKGARSTEAAAAAPVLPDDSSDTSVISSPLRWPVLADIAEGEPGFKIDPAIENAYRDLESRYHEKAERQLKLVTLDPHIPRSCMGNTNLFDVREAATEAVLEEAKMVFSLSSYVDGELMAQSSGFLIDWDKDSKKGTILTTALLIRTRSSSNDQWSVKEEYAPNAKVRVHLLDKDETTVRAHLLHYDKQLNVALFKVHMDSCAKIATFNSKLVYGQDVFVLGRDKELNLHINHGRVEFMDPTIYEQRHYMYMGCMINQSGTGGPVIDLAGHVLGMVFERVSFIPSSIILTCLDMWKKFDCAPRVHMGMKFPAIKFLDPPRVEKIYRKCNIKSGLIVTEVSHGSVAEKLGIRIGDIIVSVNGECIPTTIELENLLMRICENHLLGKKVIGSSVCILVEVFHTRKGSGRTLNLRLNISDEVEIFDAGDYLVSAQNCA